MLYDFGFIGCGNMGGALARAAVRSLPGEKIILSSRTAEKAEALASSLGVRAGTNEDAASESRYIFLGVKPQIMESVLKPLQAILRTRESRFILVTMAAGIPIERIRELAGGAYPTIRIMPNTPAAIGAGMIQFCASADVTAEDKEFFLSHMSGAGLFDELEESRIDAASAVSGCGPAFVSLFIEALSDGGVACGLPRAKALQYAAQMVKGSAELVLKSGKHPGQLKDEVCSPGGSTIEGIKALEDAAFRAAVINAVAAAYRKNTELGK